MRRVALVVTVAAIMVGPGIALAGNAGPGCGLGKMIFKGQSGFFPHTCAATTNGTSYNQLFGLTSETSECNPDSVVSNDVQKELFVASNMDHLYQEMAQGGGLHLQALADMLSISQSDQHDFCRMTQDRFSVLLNASQDGAGAMLAALDSEMMADPVLTRYVR
jgi:hypothetical protein